MNNVFVYCEMEDQRIADVSLEIISRGRALANEIDVKLEVICLGHKLNGVEKELFEYGVEIVHKADDKCLNPYLTMPHASLVATIFEKEKPRIGLFGATSVGRDLAPRIASKLKCGLTADCTELVIGDYLDRKTKQTYQDLLLQRRPAFGGNIIATIVTPDTLPQLATVREGVMKKEKVANPRKGKVKTYNPEEFLDQSDLVVKVIERHIEENKLNIKNSSIIVAGGYGVGSKENFEILFELADTLGGDVGGSRAAVDAGFIGRERQIGQTGITVRPKLYIACGISGQIQHRAGMENSAMIISINNDAEAPINKIADYVIIGDLNKVVPQMIKSYKENIA
ncbi:MAG TPA: electron transfer flavoprotein subunit alpha [Flavobacteriales bacterium]|jgi:electron transfer flavoprotein alpha subunit|nr:electron transfer flavoprotein subunit alpha [Flavobacteriales bacterium]